MQQIKKERKTNLL